MLGVSGWIRLPLRDALVPCVLIPLLVILYRGIIPSQGQMPKKPGKSAEQQALGAAIRQAREDAGYSQEGFASYAKVDRSYYGAIERGEFNLTMETLLRISRALELPISELYRRAGL
jgi:DNA-binding XRE family transcriptional regulator